MKKGDIFMKINLKVVLCLLIAICLTGCNSNTKNNSGENENKDNKQEEVSKQPEETEKPKDEDKSKTNNSDKANYSKEYLKVIENVTKENNNPDEKIECDLIYFNNDDIPDLVIGATDYWVSLYVYDGGKVYCPMEKVGYGTGGNVGYEYVEKKGVAINSGTEYAGFIISKNYSIYNKEHKLDTLAKTELGADPDIDKNDPDYEQSKKEAKELLNGSNGEYFFNDNKISANEYKNKIKEYSINENESNTKSLVGTKSVDEIKKQLQK